MGYDPLTFIYDGTIVAAQRREPFLSQLIYKIHSQVGVISPTISVFALLSPVVRSPRKEDAMKWKCIKWI